jgi:hypothetical protein
MERNLSPEPDVEGAWSDENKRRLVEIDAGIEPFTELGALRWN